MRKLSTITLITVALSASIAQVQGAPALGRKQAQREEFCRNEAARGITSTPENLPSGATRATELEFRMREQLCLKKATEGEEAQLLSHRHYCTKGSGEVRSPAKSVNDQVPVAASAKCRDGTWSFNQQRCGTCSHYGGLQLGFNKPLFPSTKILPRK
jgi:hypothetical protein